MGFLDFLYKPRTKINDGHRYPPSNEHHQKRTTTHVRSNSVPNRRKQPAAAAGAGQQQSSTSVNAHHSVKAHAKPSRSGLSQISHPNTHLPSSSRPANTSANNVRKKSREPQIEDDYAKLVRIESQVDSYIKRHAVLTNELDSVEQNLREIEDEFNEEFDQLVLTSNQKHVLQTGDRVMKKLNATLHQKPRPQSEPMPRKKAPNKSSTLPGSGKKPLPVESGKSQSKPSSPIEISRPVADSFRHINDPTTQVVPERMISVPETSQHATTTTATISGQGNSDLVHAQYAIIKTSTPNLDKQYNEPNTTMDNQFYTTTQNHTGMIEDISGLDDTDWFYEQRVTSPKMYLNMAMTLHSDNPTIEHCLRKIELLRPRILGYKAEHRYRVYHDLYNEINGLFFKLQNMDQHMKQQFDYDFNITLTELHNLSGVMERSIECQNPQCEICNSFIYRTEIQV